MQRAELYALWVGFAGLVIGSLKISSLKMVRRFSGCLCRLLRI